VELLRKSIFNLSGLNPVTLQIKQDFLALTKMITVWQKKRFVDSNEVGNIELLLKDVEKALMYFMESIKGNETVDKFENFKSFFHQ
jgi:hypothetical protein